MVGNSTKSSISLKRFSALFGLGFLGILGLLVTILNDPLYSEQADELGTSVELLAVATGVQSSLILAVAVLVGLYLAPRLGFQSLVLERISKSTRIASSLRSELPPALGGGLLVGLVLVAGERVAPELVEEQSEMTVDLLIQSIPLRLLYGGITEELLLRWGFMMVLAFALWKVVGRSGDRPSSKIVWVAIVGAAALFGVLHLPAAIPVYGPLTVEVIGFVVGLNTIGGIIFGWLFWRHSLEAAMIAHGFAHVTAISIWLVALSF